jgi:hypothetical protein
MLAGDLHVLLRHRYPEDQRLVAVDAELAWMNLIIS